MFIYKVTNTINNKVYIGQTIKNRPEDRFNGHIASSKRYKNNYFYNAINKYGKDSFLFEVIFCCFNKSDLNFYEKYFSDLYKSYNKEFGYNSIIPGNQPSLSEETKEKIRKTVKEQFLNGRKKMTPPSAKGKKPWNTGLKGTRTFTQEQKLEASLRLKGIPKKEETKFKLSKRQCEFQSINRNDQSKYVYCLELNLYFVSSVKAAKYLKAGTNSIARVCRKERKSWNGLHFKYVENIPLYNLLPNPQLQEQALGNVRNK